MCQARSTDSRDRISHFGKMGIEVVWREGGGRNGAQGRSEGGYDGDDRREKGGINSQAKSGTTISN